MRESGSERNLLKTAENQQRHSGDNGAGEDLGGRRVKNRGDRNQRLSLRWMPH